MKLYVLFAQREESYEGQYAPESLACMDGVGNDENPDYLFDEEEKAHANDEFVGVKVFEIELPKGTGDFIRNQLMGDIPTIKAVNVAVVEE